MKIWHISDTHGYHNLLKIPEDIDVVIHSGDATNYRDIYSNQIEMQDFLYWFSSLKIKHKVLVAGNHDISLERNTFDVKTNMKESDIIYLENESVTIDNVKIYGSPYTPQFGNWSFMKNRSKLNKVWSKIPDDADVVVVHGPPKGILDLSYSRDHNLESCGCSALKKRIMTINPKLFLSGHIHNNKDIINAGTMTLSCLDTIFSNGSVVTDGKFGALSSNGNILTV